MHSFYFSVLSLVSITVVSGRSFPRSDVCNFKGYDNGVDAYFYDNSGKYGGFNKCSQHCLTDSKCNSIGYDSRVCMHFSVPVKGNVERDDGSPDTYYDRNCFATTSKPLTTTIPTTTTSTSTTKVTTTKSATSTTTKSTSSTTKGSTTSSQTTSTKLTTTSKSSSTKTTTTTTSSMTTTTAVSIPTDCPGIPQLYTINDMNWFNSSHNCDCASSPDVGDGTGCLKDGQWCDPRYEKDCTNCGIAVCSTGLPPQPIGYGPPDNVTFTFAEGNQCQQLNPAVVHRYEVGDGFVLCGGSYDFMNFYGSSNANVNQGRVDINGYPAQCKNGDTLYPHYSGNFTINCTRDKQNNATCVNDKPFKVSLTWFERYPAATN